MIIDTLKNCEIYYGMNAGFEKAFDFIKKATSENLPAGKYEIDGSNIYAMVQEYKTKAPEEAKFEAHRKYIDIQYIISGVEKMEMIDVSKATEITEYDAEKDFQFFDYGNTAVLGCFEDEDFAVFFPQDVHKPGMAVDSGSSAVKKIVVKIKVD